MLALISSIPTAVREGFDVQDLPSRAIPVSQEQMSQVFGGCSAEGSLCAAGWECCNKNARNQCLGCNGNIFGRRGRRCGPVAC